MDFINEYHQNAAVLLTRIFLGLLFFFQGYDAVFRIGVKQIIEAYSYEFKEKGIPGFLTVVGVCFTSYVELIGGLFLIAGLFEYYTLYLLGATLIIASVAFGINTSVWDTRHVFPRLV